MSGRKRDPGEMNGKSGNINNCCSQIYPKGTKIPPNELVCIFDADQVRETLAGHGAALLVAKCSAWLVKQHADAA